jgi:hypothetical protein
VINCPPKPASSRPPRIEALHPTESGVVESVQEREDDTALIALDPGEMIILAVRPHWRMLAVDLAPPVVALGLISAAWVGVVPFSTAAPLRATLVILAFAAVIVAALAVLEFRLRLYVLTDRRVVRRSGALRLRQREVALPSVDRVECHPGRAQQGQTVRVGAVHFRSDMGVLAWEYVPAPADVARRASDAVRRYGRRNHH